MMGLGSTPGSPGPCRAMADLQTLCRRRPDPVVVALSSSTVPDSSTQGSAAMRYPAGHEKWTTWTQRLKLSRCERKRLTDLLRASRTGLWTAVRARAVLWG